MTKRPVKQIRSGNVVVSIWENEKRDGNGRYRSVTIQRTYRDGDGKWRYADSFFERDLLQVAHGVTKAFDACGEIRSEAKAQNGGAPAEEVPEDPF